jgi:hypothetical protein
MRDDAEILRSYGIEPDPVIEAYKKDVDITLLIENLRRTPEERIRMLQDAVYLGRELQRAVAAAR